jgi:hypothetical protein
MKSRHSARGTFCTASAGNAYLNEQKRMQR